MAIIPFDNVQSESHAQEIFANGDSVAICGEVVDNFNALMDAIVIYHL